MPRPGSKQSPFARCVDPGDLICFLRHDGHFPGSQVDGPLIFLGECLHHEIPGKNYDPFQSQYLHGIFWNVYLGEVVNIPLTKNMDYEILARIGNADDLGS